MSQVEHYNAPKGYINISRLFKNQRHDVLLATRQEDGQQVVLKSSRSNTVHLKEASKLSHEFDILNELDHKGIPKVYDVVHQGDSICLVQEYFAGPNMGEVLFKGKLEHDTIFDVLIQISEILSYLHERGIIHKDLNSSNIILGSDGKAKLIDFGISTDLHFEQTESALLDHIEGTLTYIAPEQTGRTAYSVTQSCDLYSFGILLYELFTSKPPFDSSDPLEIIHFHLSRKPIPLNKIISDVPEGLQDVLDKLLEKNPDDRYQSARGLNHDLKVLRDIYLGKKKLKDLKIGELDKIDHYRQTQKLYGRDDELEMLLGYYKKLDQLKSMMVLVAGYSGVGKSALIDNVKYPIIQDHGVFISGKYDQLKRNIPYYAFIEAFQQLIKTLLSETEDKIDHWRKRITFALADSGALITEVIPQLTKIIGKQKEVTKLQPAEQEARFNKVLLDFVYAFSSTHSPLVIFLDDLQWADLPSLNLIRMILNNPRKEGVMLMGAYRDNEVDDAHPLMITLNDLKKSNANVEEIKLAPLDEKTTCLITEDSFGMDQEQATELGLIVYSKTKGNPFFINRFLKSLYENQYVVKSAEGKWVFDSNQLEQLEYTDNVVDLMLEELIDLPEESRSIVKRAAVLGNIFELEDLANISGLSQQLVYRDLRPAMKGGYIAAMDKKYRSLSLSRYLENEGQSEIKNGISPRFRFTHDKVQQAAYSLISDFERERVHLDIARLLLKNASEEDLQEDVFVLLNHFSNGLSLIEDDQEKRRVTELCLSAGRKAKDSTSYDLAVRYLRMGQKLLGKASWNDQYELTFDLISELGECEYLNNNHDKAEACFSEVMQFAKTRYEKLKVLYVHSSLYLKIGNTSESLRIGLEAVKLYNVRFPSNPRLIQLAAMYQMIKYIILFSTKYRKPESLFKIKDCTDEELITLNKFFIDLATSAYQQDQNLMMLVIFRIIKSYLKHGFTDASGWGFSGFSVVMLSVIKLQNRGFYLWDITERMHSRTHSPLIKWRLGYTVNTFYYPWSRPIKEIFEPTKEMIKACVLNGDQIFTGYSVSMYLRQRWFASVNLHKLLDPKENYIDLLSHSQGGYDFFIGQYQVIKALTGKTGTDHWDDENFSGVETLVRLKEEGNMTKLAFFVIAKNNMLYYFGHYREAVDLSIEAVKYLDNIPGDLYEFDFAFYSALSIAANYDKFTADEKNKHERTFNKYLKQIKYWKKGYPANFEPHYCVLIAEKHAMKGQLEFALQYYEKAMNLAEKRGYTYVEAIANERAANYSFAHDFNKQARVYLQDAYNAYYKWGALAKCKLLEQSYPSLLRIDRSAEDSSQKHASVTHTGGSSTTSLDLSTILKSSQSLAGQTKYDDLLVELMDIVMENAGAQRACLVLDRKGQLSVEVESMSGKEGTKVLNSIPLDEFKELPNSMIMYTWRSGESVVVSDAQTEERFHGDSYISNSGTLSAMCLPISEKGRVVGVLYLENNLMKGVFSDHRLELLEMLSGQIGISIENALLIENLEEKVQERTQELEKQKVALEEEKEKSDHLLLNILPKKIANELKTTGRSEARSYKNATVMFCDIVGFTHLGEKMDAKTLVENIHEFFSGIDDILVKYKIEKIKTIGDAYLCASGLKEKEDGSSALAMVQAAKEIISYLHELNESKEKEGRYPFQLRIGIHTGPVVAGVVGKAKFAYDIWGDTVNTAARMESHGEPMRINISEETYQLVKEEFQFEHRGKIEAKNKGLVDMYFVSLA